MIEINHKWDTSKECFVSFYKKLAGDFGEGTKMKDNIIEIDNRYAKGSIEFFILNAEMSLYKLDITFYEAIKLNRIITEKPEYYSFLFSMKEGYDFHKFNNHMLEEEMEEIGLEGKRTVIYSSSDVPSLLKTIPNEHTKSILLVVSVEEVKKTFDLNFDQKNWPNLFSDNSVYGYVTMDAKMIEEVNKLFSADYPGYIKITYTKGLIYEIMAMLLYEIKHKNERIVSGTGVAESARLVQIKNLLIDDFSKPCPTLESMAKNAHMSVTKFKTVFKELFSLPYYQFYQHYRLMMAKKLLTGGSSVKDAAYEVGFSNPAHFTAAFKKKFNKLPSEFIGSADL